jgi:hypothetical protein
MEKFWINNPSILLENYYEILPNSNMTRVRQMNTITRFIIYYIILCLIFNSNDQLILFGFIIILMITVFYFIYIKDEIGIQNDLIAENTDPIEKFTDLDCNDCKNDNKNLLNDAIIDIYDNSKDRILKGTTKNDKNIILESGYIDSDGNYKIGKDYSDIDIKEWNKEKKQKNKKISYEKDKLYRKATSRKPTVDNPFTNIVFSDYLDASNIAEPCNTSDDNIAQDMQNLYNSSIYRSVGDVFERENSQRMFYTVPIRTVPNDQTDFANWLYKSGPTCKENSQNCTYYEIPTMSSQRY